MKFDKETIVEKIYNNTSEVLKNGDPKFNEQEIRAAIDLMFRVIKSPTEIEPLQGLPKLLIPDFQNFFIEDRGNLSSLLNIAKYFESFLKKVAFSIDRLEENQIERITLIPLLKTLGINDDLSNQSGHGYPYFSENHKSQFVGKKEYLLNLYNCYHVRNQVHTAPNFNEVKIYNYIQDVLVSYLFTCLCFKDSLSTLPNSPIESDYSKNEFDKEENKMLYDFISYGNTSTELKGQILDAFILHHLIAIDSMNIDQMKLVCEEYFQVKFDDRFFARRIMKLEMSSKIEYIDSIKKSFLLTESEKSRLTSVKAEYEENKELFLLMYNDAVSNHRVDDYFDPLMEELAKFFTLFFQTDIKEAKFEGDQLTDLENSCYEPLMEYLRTICESEEVSRSLFKELLSICADNDFIIRLSASQVLGKVSNSNQFQNYMRLQKKEVFLDTQIVLYALCTGYDGYDDGYENPYYKIVEELMEFRKSENNIELCFSRKYLNEVAHHLKMALHLIAFEGSGYEKYSSNVFYSFYNYLKENDCLVEEHKSFADFMEEWMLLTEEDAYSNNFTEIAIENISTVIKEDLSISIESLPHYDSREAVISELEKTIRSKQLPARYDMPLSNDALMLCHLENDDLYESEPFFLSWDKSFIEYRRTFKAKFKRGNPYTWHLFNPAKFINHISFLNLKIDTKSISNEYMCVLNNDTLMEQGRCLVDTMNKFLDIRTIGKEQKRKYIKILKSIFNEDEFSTDISPELANNLNAVTNPFNNVLDIINSHYHDKSANFSFEDYRNTLLNENCFKEITKSIGEEVKAKLSKDIPIVTQLISKIDDIIEKHLQEDEKVIK